MTTGLACADTPEGRHLQDKRADLLVLESKLAERELELATVKAELGIFEAAYLRAVGVRIAELDDIEARIAEALARRRAGDDDARERAASMRARATESASEASGAVQGEKCRAEFRPSETLKRLYREVAKAVHPDLASNEHERVEREKLMARANRAYANADEEGLKGLLAEWRSSPHSVEGDGIGAELIRVIRMIDQARLRLRRIDDELSYLQSGDLYQLKLRADAEQRKGLSLLDEMASRLDQQISEARRQLAKGSIN